MTHWISSFVAVQMDVPLATKWKILDMEGDALPLAKNDARRFPACSRSRAGTMDFGPRRPAPLVCTWLPVVWSDARLVRFCWELGVTCLGSTSIH